MSAEGGADDSKSRTLHVDDGGSVNFSNNTKKTRGQQQPQPSSQAPHHQQGVGGQEHSVLGTAAVAGSSSKKRLRSRSSCRQNTARDASDGNENRHHFWTDTFPELDDVDNPDVTLYITQAYLSDNHHPTTTIAANHRSWRRAGPALNDDGRGGATSSTFLARAGFVYPVSSFQTPTSTALMTNQPNSRIDLVEEMRREVPQPIIAVHRDKMTTTTTATTTTSRASERDNNEHDHNNDRSARTSLISRGGRKRKKFRHLPNGDNGDGVCNPDPTNIDDKYWAQRNRFFSRFDQGIQLDIEGWFSVTPEVMAQHIAHRIVEEKQVQLVDGTTTIAQAEVDCKENEKGMIVLDAFGGVGGNSIAFALQSGVVKVVCVDISWDKLCMTAHNAQIYNIPSNRLLLIHANICDVLLHYTNHSLCRKDDDNNNSKSNPRDGTVTTIIPNQNFIDTASQHLTNDPTTNLDTFIPTSTKTKILAPIAVSAIQTASTMDSPRLIGVYMVGGLELLPDRFDSIFLSPPWGGPEYQKIGPCQYNLQCIQLLMNNDGLFETTAPVSSSSSSDPSPVLPIQEDNSTRNDQQQIPPRDFNAHDDDVNKNNDETSLDNPETSLTTTPVRTGQDLLQMALDASRRGNRIVYYLPRNTNGLALGQSLYECGYGGFMELEQILLNGKLKAVSMYIVKH